MRKAAIVQNGPPNLDCYNRFVFGINVFLINAYYDGLLGSLGAIIVYYIRASQIAIAVWADSYLIPLLLGTCVVNGSESGATRERITTDACYTVADSYTGESGAPIERIITDACYTVANSYAGEAVATIERTITDACYTIRYYKLRYNLSVKI